jgi:ABC-2 type transport system permease protein
VLALCVAMAAAVTALTALVSTIARTQRQADAVGSMVTFGLTMLGGNFVFAGAAPEVLRQMALLTPNGWALRGFTDLASGSPALASTVMPVVVIVGFSVVVGGVALVLGRRVVVR